MLPLWLTIKNVLFVYFRYLMLKAIFLHIEKNIIMFAVQSWKCEDVITEIYELVPTEVEEEEVPEEENEIEEGEEEEEEVYIKFKLFESYPRYGMLKNLLFDDDTKSFGEIEPGEKF